jgi:hypothetical protein
MRLILIWGNHDVLAYREVALQGHIYIEERNNFNNLVYQEDLVSSRVI